MVPITLFNNVETWGGMVGGATGAPINIHLDAENNITGNLELNAPTTNSVALDVQQPKLIPIETPDGGIRLVSVENISTKSLNPTHYITKSKYQMQALLNDIRTNGIQEPIKYDKVCKI